MLSMLAACPCAQCAVLTRITTHIHLTRPKKCHPLASCPMPAACPHAQYRCTYLHTNIMHKHVHSEQYARHILSKRGGLVRLTSNTLFLFSSLLKPFKNCLRASQATHKGELNQVCRWWLHIKRLLEADKQHALQVLKSSASTMAPVPNLTLNAYLPLC